MSKKKRARDHKNRITRAGFLICLNWQQKKTKSEEERKKNVQEKELRPVIPPKKGFHVRRGFRKPIINRGRRKKERNFLLGEEELIWFLVL